MNRREFLAASAALTAACGRRSDRSSEPGPTALPPAGGEAQVLLIDGGGVVSFGAYLEELLGVEGLVGVRRVVAQVQTPGVLAGVPAAIVYGNRLSSAWIDALDAFVRRGGALAAIVPPAALLARLGIEETGPALPAPDGVRFADAAAETPLSLHVAGRDWRVGEDASVEARFSEGAIDGAPAVVTVRRGAGAVTCWAFDVAHNCAFIRQGNPMWTDVDRDGYPLIRFVDHMFGWVRPELLERPDADMYQRALVGILAGGGNATVGPILGVDFFPGTARTVLVATGDAHGVGADDLDRTLRRIENLGARLTVFYEPPETPLWRRYARRARWAANRLPVVGPRVRSGAAPPSPQQVNEWRARGHEFSPHPTAVPDLEDGLARAWRDFEDDGYGSEHVSIRTHAVLWKGWVENPRAHRRYGVRMNLDVYHVGPVMRRPDGSWSHGHLIGSGLPARFVDEGGTVIDCYQQPTQILDEQYLAVVGGPEGLDGKASAAVAAEQLARALDGPPAALCSVFHIDSFVPSVGRGVEAGAFLDGVLTAFRDAGVPIWPVYRWLAFLDGRRTTAVTRRTWDAETRRLACAVEVSALADPGVQLMLPADLGGRPIQRVLVDGVPAALDATRRSGREWVRWLVRPGSARLEAHYA